MYERFTNCARTVMQRADAEARRFNAEYIGTEHLLLALVSSGDCVATTVLKSLGADLVAVRTHMESLIIKADRAGPGRLPQTPRVRRAIESSLLEARALDQRYIGTEHILLGLLRDPENVAAQILVNEGLPAERVRQEILNFVGREGFATPEGICASCNPRHRLRSFLVLTALATAAGVLAYWMYCTR